MTPTLIFRAFWEISVKGILTFKFVKLSVMEILAHIEQLKYLDWTIRQHASGTPKQLAIKMGVSVATVYRRIYELKKLGAHIKYIKRQQHYIYTDESFTLKF